LSNANLDGEIQRYIIANNKYAITVENFEVIFDIESDDKESADFYTKNYAFMSAPDKINVFEYINENIDQYIKAVLLNDKITCKNEPQENIEKFLKSESVSLETKNAAQ
jgi:hypothetical protein